MTSSPVTSQPNASSSSVTRPGPKASKEGENSHADTHHRSRSADSSSIYSVDRGERSGKQGRCVCCCTEKTRLRRRCCCICEDGDGDPDEWNYPWNKSCPKCLGLCCMWYSFCLVFPCSLCIPRYRNLLCLVREGCWDGTCCGSCLFGLPPPGSKPRPHGGRAGSKVSHWSDSS